MIGSDIGARHWRRRQLIVAMLAGSCAVALAAAPRTILVVGDSLSAEYGLARGTGWVALLERRIAQQKVAARVINASISGDTTSGGRSRLAALLVQHKPDVVVIELGGNDALRGLPLAMTQRNLAAMVEAARKSGARVLLVGVEVPPNYGPDYTAKFAHVYREVAMQMHVPLVPSIVAGIADAPNVAGLFQPDRIHPLAKAHPRMLDNVWPELKKLLWP